MHLVGGGDRRRAVRELAHDSPGSVPVTAPARTVIDCAKVHTAPELVEQAVTQGRDRGLFSEADVQPAILYLADFGRQGP